MNPKTLTLTVNVKNLDEHGNKNQERRTNARNSVIHHRSRRVSWRVHANVL